MAAAQQSSGTAAPSAPDPETPAEALRVLPTSWGFVFPLQERRENRGIHQAPARPELEVLPCPGGCADLCPPGHTGRFLSLLSQGVRPPEGLRQDGSGI